MPQMISDKHREMHARIEGAIDFVQSVQETQNCKSSELPSITDDTIAAVTDALGWYDRMLSTLHGIVMKDSNQRKLDALQARVAYLESRVRKLEGANW